MLWFAWQLFEKMGPHGFSIKEVASTALTERTITESLSRVWRKAKKPQGRNHSFCVLSFDNDIVTKHGATTRPQGPRQSAEEKRFERESEAIPHRTKLLQTNRSLSWQVRVAGSA